LHKCFLAGFLQTAVSDAPRRELHVVSGVWRGAADTALAFLDNFRFAASLDRKRLGAKTDAKCLKSIRGVFDKEVRRKPLAFATDAVSYGN